MSRSVCRQGSVPSSSPLRQTPSCRLAIFRTGLNARSERSWASGSLSRPPAPFSLRYGMARWLCPGCAKGGDCQDQRYRRGRRHDSSPLAWMYRTHDHTMISRQRPADYCQSSNGTPPFRGPARMLPPRGGAAPPVIDTLAATPLGRWRQDQCAVSTIRGA